MCLGIDPGLSGALALVQGPRLLRVDDMPAESIGGTGTVKRRVSAPQLAALLREIKAQHDDDILAVIERVSAGSGQGVSSVFSLGDTAGCIRGVLQTLGFRVEFVTPSQWKQTLKVSKDKNVARTMACARWPEQAALFARVKDADRAEAALLAAYGWQVYA